jgi:hypothetical protein
VPSMKARLSGEAMLFTSQPWSSLVAGSTSLPQTMALAVVMLQLASRVAAYTQPQVFLVTLMWLGPPAGQIEVGALMSAAGVGLDADKQLCAEGSAAQLCILQLYPSAPNCPHIVALFLKLECRARLECILQLSNRHARWANLQDVNVGTLRNTS